MSLSSPPNRLGTAALLLVLGLAGANLGRAAAPVIVHGAPVEILYNVSIPGDAQFGYRIVATGSPTDFAATGLPPDATLDRATGWINGSRNHPGTYDVAVRATNADGTGTAIVRLAIHPTATGVISSSGRFHAGQTFTFTVRYNAPVTVSGTPHLTLALGPIAAPEFKPAVYVSGSGSNELVFEYAVADDDLAPDGVRLLPSAPAGGAICDASGLAASPSLPVRHFVSGITIATVDGVFPTRL
jgi:hypothetical protein